MDERDFAMNWHVLPFGGENPRKWRGILKKLSSSPVSFVIISFSVWLTSKLCPLSLAKQGWFAPSWTNC